MGNTCIRVLADPVQIKECKTAITNVNERILKMANIYGLAGNPTRLKILFLLFKETEMCPCDLSDVLDISVGGISQHLRKLKDGNLVRDKKVGQTIFYSLIPENIRNIEVVLKNLVDENKTLTV